MQFTSRYLIQNNRNKLLSCRETEYPFKLRRQKRKPKSVLFNCRCTVQDNKNKLSLCSETEYRSRPFALLESKIVFQTEKTEEKDIKTRSSSRGWVVQKSRNKSLWSRKREPPVKRRRQKSKQGNARFNQRSMVQNGRNKSS
jgi:hypothetical protein